MCLAVCWVFDQKKKSCQTFLKQLCIPCGWHEKQIELRRLLPHDRTLVRINESLRCEVGVNGDPNVASFRHLLVIDESDTDTALAMLLGNLRSTLAKPVTVVRLGDFALDGGDAALLDATSRVRAAMERPGIVIMVNTGAIHSAFYDVFNRHFQPVVLFEVNFV